MSGLQTCHKCGAQFDVSSFSPGQQFSCGSCGAVLTAQPAGSPGGAAPPDPSTPAVSGRAPGSRGSTPSRPAAGRKTPGARPGTTRPTPQPPKAGRRASGAAPSGGGKRGPQYKPPERHQEPGAGARKRPAKAARAGAGGRGTEARRGRGERAEREREAPSGRSPTLLYGAAAAVVLAVIVVLVVTSGDDPAPNGGGGGGNGPSVVANGGGGDGGNGTSQVPSGPDTLESLDAGRRESPPRRASEFRELAKRYLAVGGEQAESHARDLYQELIDQHDANDPGARKFLGWTDFQGDILGEVLAEDVEAVPESIHNRRGYPFLDAVTDFNGKRWLRDEDDIALAKRAVAEMREHVKKLETDNQYRAMDQIRANIAQMSLLAPYNYTTRWAPPFLICYSSKERMSEFDLSGLSFQERKAARKKLLDERKKWKKVLDEKEAIYSQLYAKYMDVFGERYNLKNLYDPWGGRPDIPAHKKNFEDGVPLVVWIFTDREAFGKHHSEVKGENISPMAAGYFSPKTSWVYLFDESKDPESRIFEIDKNLHEGTHQLEHWFTRQRTKWREPRFSQNAVSEGIAEYLGSVEMAKDRKIKWTGINQVRLKNMIAMSKTFADRKQDFPLFPVERLAFFTSYGSATRWGMAEWGFSQGMVMSLFYQQSWAFVYFLLHYKDGKYREKFLDYYDAVLMRETGEGMSKRTFKRVFQFRDDEDWNEIEAEWKGFLMDDLLKRKPKDFMYVPPARDEWPETDGE